MANGYKVTISSIATDGTNLFVEISICSGSTTYQSIRPIFPAGTPASDITDYIQNIATTGPALPADIAALVGTSVAG